MSTLPGTGAFEQVHRGFGSILEIEVSQFGVLQIRRYSYFGGKDAAYINLSPEEAEAVDGYFLRRLGREPMSLDEMATALSFSGYLVYGPDDAMPERVWRRIGEKEGYFNTLETEDSVANAITFLRARGYGIMPPPQGVKAPEAVDDDTQACTQYPPLARTPEAWPRVEDRAGLIQGRVPTEEASRPAQTVPYQSEHVDMPATPQDAETPEAWPGVAERAGLLQDYVHAEETSRPAMTARQGKEVSLENTASPTVLEHCMASEARQGKTVVREDILYELRMRGIPCMARWDDWSAEVARLCPGRWEV